ncbi:MAG: hypothetical protein UR68_C0008G0008 [Candidatus Roizmanbacteria bacterium GW2011_GWA2_35_19]|uniref:EamA domain-containing protein n=2 Tax=Candidatus Roizmaniibacteriota TaxID=1752723 RepID=A0A0G0F169_9BACT|nr:MAG: hypothetical protein UR63_C0011G0009 [Candidatus Roizmanbacteria bacterium GW2011_GWC2_35_12]KKP73097.1 MAG: hypothetical protein UR68_C0008G0008 [Candidatus Roizmanbacteria bacterium GW2011_GWA2_35_19]
MFFSSIVYYLIIKKAQINKIDNRLYMVVNFSIPAFLFLFFNIKKGLDIFIHPLSIFYIFIASFIFSYIGSVISYIAINKAPNAGYSLVIQKSYAIFTSIAAIYLFQSSLPLIKFMAILLIVVSTGAISITRGKKLNFKNYLWVIYSVISFFCFGGISLFNKYMVTKGIPPTVVLFWTMVFVSSISIINLIKNGINIAFHPTLGNWLTLFGIGFSVTFFYYFKIISEVTAPNIGFVNAINTASNAFYTVLVAFIFKDHLSWKKFMAVLGVTFGLILLVV